jgi:copper(I)-binding protein
MVLAACSAGQITQTAVKVPSVPGVNARAGDIAIRNAMVTFPPTGTWPIGSSVPLTMRLANTGTAPDMLTGASSPAAEGVDLVAGSSLPTGTASPGVSGSPTETPSATPSPTPTPSGSPTPTGSPTTTPSGSPTPSGAPPQAPVINPGSLLILDSSGEQQLVLVKIKEAIVPGEVVELTLTFRRAGKVTLKLPVAPPATPLPRTPLEQKSPE